MDDARIRKLQFDRPCLVERPADLFYLTGLTLSKGCLFIRKGGAILYVDGRYYDRAKKEAPCEVMHWDNLKKIEEKEIDFDSSFVSYERYLAMQKGFPHVKWVPRPNPLKDYRAIKEPEEISALKKAASLTWRGYQKIVEELKEGITEEELALIFEIFCRKNGASGLSFRPIIAFGDNSAYPHHRAGKSRLKKGQAVLVDVGAIVDHYCGDMTRFTFLNGLADPLSDLEEIVRRAQQKAIDYVKPGIKFGELDQIVQHEFSKTNVKQFYIHSLGHGIGLEAHEFPLIRADGEDRDVELKPGMVFTVEPGLYQPGIGGVRLEDMVLVTNTGCENLFPDRQEV